MFLVEDVFDIASRGGVLVAGRLYGGVVAAGSTLFTYDRRPVRVMTIELIRGKSDDAVTLLVERAEDLRVVPKMYLRG